MEGKMVKLSPPWQTFYKEMQAMFGLDPEIWLDAHLDGAIKEIDVYVDNARKADALSRLLPAEKTFGDVNVAINVIPANDESATDLFRAAFAKNPVFKFADHLEDLFSNPIYYVVFAKEVVQIHNDDIGDRFGLKSTLYQDIARDIFGTEEDNDWMCGVHFCTDEK